MRIVRWIKSLFIKQQPDDIDYDYEDLPSHVKEFMKDKYD
jgi:hypothetical protein